MARAGNPPAWAAHYEALRRHALGDAPVAFVPLGLGVLRRHGLVAWIATEANARRLAVTPVESMAMGSRPTVSGASSELVNLLAGTALLVVKGECP